MEPITLITGAATGIGAAIARRIGGPDARLILHTGSNTASLNALADALRADGASVVTMVGDLAAPQTAPALVAQAIASFGGLGRIVSNAGRAHRADIGDLQPEDLEAAFAIMPVAFLRLMTAALPHLKTADNARVVAISSFVAHGFGVNDMLFPASSAAKAALEALAKTLAVQLGPDGVCVNCVAPGFVRKDAGGHTATPSAAMERTAQITPNRRLGEPADIAEMVAFLLSRGARHITGQTIHVDGGLLLA
ncbi:short chain alcohol dehydrogenase-related dehydrogenase (plasmid) [Ketogulonicigenium robustum]|uniref:Short chain alcohol dehydrogenase-related dehydrogenase n=1 Tax=Ketogulonicigenium robustum TaxID=92947 RepID=A0A1W6P316_9RHOB|nr:SDR family oxidoreductase [Ketogulonicigenium robustum]ARO15902.1 short chain alcohol dehydrogenase-related dehydrogenase [Ketogulonicigenium robustum]